MWWSEEIKTVEQAQQAITTGSKVCFFIGAIHVALTLVLDLPSGMIVMGSFWFIVAMGVRRRSLVLALLGVAAYALDTVYAFVVAERVDIVRIFLCLYLARMLEAVMKIPELEARAQKQAAAE